MTELFIKIVNMSISASWIVLAVIIFRILLKKAPKWVNPLLWSIVGLRLILPFSIESVLSLIPSVETISPEIIYDEAPAIHSGIDVLNRTVNPVISESSAPVTGASVNPLQIWIPVFSAIWIAGLVCMLAYTALSFRRLRKRMDTAVVLKENIYRSEKAESPFVLGLIHPRIYLPFQLPEQNMDYVIAHEQAHIKRHDNWFKTIGFLLLSVYWFNPVMWAAYILFCRDIELACDERVIRNFNRQQRADYSQALLDSSVCGRKIAACPLSFGEVGVKDRVKNVLNYKEPAFWMIVIAVVAIVVLAACFLTNPPERSQDVSAEKDNIMSGGDTESHEPLANVLMAEVSIDFGECKGYAIKLIMTEGRYYTEEEVGPGGGTYEENYVGTYILQVTDDGKVLDEISLNQDWNCGEINFPGEFALCVSDYNKDGFADFTIGSYGSSNMNMYELYSVGLGGKICNICEKSLKEASKECSIFLRQEEDSTGFYTSMWNNAAGETEHTRWEWKQEEGSLHCLRL